MDVVCYTWDSSPRRKFLKAISLGPLWISRVREVGDNGVDLKVSDLPVCTNAGMRASRNASEGSLDSLGGAVEVMVGCSSFSLTVRLLDLCSLSTGLVPLGLPRGLLPDLLLGSLLGDSLLFGDHDDLILDEPSLEGSSSRTEDDRHSALVSTKNSTLALPTCRAA